MENSQNPDQETYLENQRFDLSDNLDHIPKIKRMWRAQWPEFSWLTIPEDENSRCYQMFAPDISRVGYGDPDPSNDNKCEVYSIMCPQQGIWIEPIEGTLNIEVTVTSSGGWVTEDPMVMDAQITIKPAIWFSPDTVQNKPLIKALWDLFEDSGIPFPSSKENAIRLNAYGVNQKDQPEKTPVLDITNGMDPNYEVPSFAQHYDPNIYDEEAAVVVYLGVEIGSVISTGNEIADWFNNLIMDIFNLASGNLLQNGNVLSWNVWALAPEEVYTREWEMHADYWRFSLDVNHRSPDGNGRNPQYFDGSPFNPKTALICEKLEELKNKLSHSAFKNTTIVKGIDALLESILDGDCHGEVAFL